MSSPRKTPSGAPVAPAALWSALRHVLRPLVRLLLGHQVPYPLLSQLLKSVYVEVALRDFPIEGKRQTDSRLSLITGIHRKDVRRLREHVVETHSPPPAVSLGAQLVARWTGVPDFLDDEGHPRPLARGGDTGGAPGFDDLVASVSTDVRPRAVLDEWRRLGVAYLDPEGRICLNVEAFVPSRGFTEKAYYFGRNLHDHLAAAGHNLEGGEPPRLDRSVYYGALTPESVNELSKLATRAGMEALQAVNRRALELQKRDAGKRSARHRMNFGIFFHQADTAQERGPEPDEPAER